MNIDRAKCSRWTAPTLAALALALPACSSSLRVETTTPVVRPSQPPGGVDGVKYSRTTLLSDIANTDTLIVLEIDGKRHVFLETHDSGRALIRVSEGPVGQGDKP